ncbi:MAG: SH3 domain-containing protein [Candidatus Latescibacteria bacterium]|nr:SH3 domain-containing protein [Candidatus Latescibacterota bacterium]NIM21412.1 SH3 domain-containing protein [Candidatus Latescibacterota bacterium]NIM65593.1 SH3 domain-containing protein [Candidatus Latescibacterota bacterium]NIO01973.1 SH3 domain-containing protein [Candidatus Latescibacterota bacterium]NIO28785.1 SH3 domain-containing protein [Candidatus Latescibacterota bacterium]
MAILDENKRLRVELKTKDLDIAKLNAEFEAQTDRNKYLEEVNESTKHDLEQVEKQFVSLERRLQIKETKASAVATLAEVRLVFDNLVKEDSLFLDSPTATEIRQKLNESDELIQKQNYPAAVYYANRAHRLLQNYSSKRPPQLPAGKTRIVSVQKAKIRRGPSTKHEVVGILSFGTIVIQEDQVKDWARIKTKKGLAGWIYKKLIR